MNKPQLFPWVQLLQLKYRLFTWGMNRNHLIIQSYHIKVLGNPPFAQLFHPLTHICEAGVVVVCILLCQVINIAQ